MSRKQNVNEFLFGRREASILQTKYNLRSAAAFRPLSPNTSSSSDSCDDSFDQICKPFRKASAPATKSDTTSTMSKEEQDSMVPLPSATMIAANKIDEDECDELDEMFKNIALKDTTAKIPVDWLENNESPLAHTGVLSTVYEGGESKYRSTRSDNLSTMSKDSAQLELSADSLIDLVKKQTDTSKDSLDRSYLTSKNVVSIELNDTLEDVEYVCDERNRYLLKPVSRASKISPAVSLECSNVDSSVIVVDSSPDTSFVTAQNDLKAIDVNNIKTETLSDKSSVLYDASIDSKENISVASTISSTNMSYITAKNDFKIIDIDDIKSENSYNKTSTVSDGKTNSWSTLDSSDNASVTPAIDKRNDSLLVAENQLKSSGSDDLTPEVSGDGQMFTCISYPKTASFFEDKTIDSDTGKSSEYYTAAANDSTISTSQPSVSAARYNTLDDIPSFSTDSTVSSVNYSKIPLNNSTDSSKHFNDSLERIEYMMKKGRELQQKLNTKVSDEKPTPSRPMNSPVSQYKIPTPKTIIGSSQKRAITTTGSKTSAVKAKLFTNSAKKPVQPSPQAVTPATRILQPFNRIQSAGKTQPMERKFISPRASPIVSPAFKKPNFPTPVAKTATIQSRIPTSKTKNFEHIVSPIGAYIKNIAAPPLLANVKPTSDFFDSSYCNKMSKELDYSIISDGGAGKVVSSLPVKFFTSSEQQRVIDEKFQKIPGGEKLNRIIGQIPSVISHQGRIHSGSPVKRPAPIDESFANVSVMSGDISVQVVRDVKRQ